MPSRESETFFAPSSFRDPRARVFFSKGRIFRAISAEADSDFRKVCETGFLRDLVFEGKLVPFKEVPPTADMLPPELESGSTLLELEKLPYITYPYEWSFSGLKEAALLHLEIQIRALDRGIKLNDASAYNIQFVGPKPVFIDHVSFSPYEEDELWVGHSQFCNQFLNPLVLQSCLRIPFNDWYRGSMEGLEARELAAILPLSSYFSPSLLGHVLLPAYFEKRATRSQRVEGFARKQGTHGKLPRKAFRGMLQSIKKLISNLSPKENHSHWSKYTEDNTYDNDETLKKIKFVSEFADKVKPAFVWDIGCNTGQFSQALLENGGACCIGLESDSSTVDLAFKRATTKKLNFLPLYQNITNPSPSQGWNETERSALRERVPADGILALAVLHHLVIGSYVPMVKALVWLIELAPNGIIEFVPPSDPQVQRMLAGRKDFFHEYSAEIFDTVINKLVKVIQSETLSTSGRRLIWYSRSFTV